MRGVLCVCHKLSTDLTLNVKERNIPSICFSSIVILCYFYMLCGTDSSYCLYLAIISVPVHLLRIMPKKLRITKDEDELRSSDFDPLNVLLGLDFPFCIT